MRLLVCGSRDWGVNGSERDRARLEIEAIGPEFHTLIHGDAGARRLQSNPTSDRLFASLAEQWAHASGHDLHVVAFPADWSRDGKAAGPLRNARMLREGKPDRGLAFGALWKAAFDESPVRWRKTGTGDMTFRMLSAGLPVRWVATPDAVAVDLREMPEAGR